MGPVLGMQQLCGQRGWRGKGRSHSLVVGDDASEWLSVSTATCVEFSRLSMEERKVVVFFTFGSTFPVNGLLRYVNKHLCLVKH